MPSANPPGARKPSRENPRRIRTALSASSMFSRMIWLGSFSPCSAKTVGRFRFRKPTQRVIKGDFHGIVGAKTVRTSGHHTKFVVEALDGTVGDLAFGPKPVQQQLLMGA